mgnify:CR=1 FL=1
MLQEVKSVQMLIVIIIVIALVVVIYVVTRKSIRSPTVNVDNYKFTDDSKIETVKTCKRGTCDTIPILEHCRLRDCGRSQGICPPRTVLTDGVCQPIPTTLKPSPGTTLPTCADKGVLMDGCTCAIPKRPTCTRGSTYYPTINVCLTPT